MSQCISSSCVFPDAPSTEQQELFTQKLQQCCMLFDFLDSVTDLKSKEIKRATLNELVDYVSTNRGVLVESAYPEITNMVRVNKCIQDWDSLDLFFTRRKQTNANWSKATAAAIKIPRGLLSVTV